MLFCACFQGVFRAPLLFGFAFRGMASKEEPKSPGSAGNGFQDFHKAPLGGKGETSFASQTQSASSTSVNTDPYIAWSTLNTEKSSRSGPTAFPGQRYRTWANWELYSARKHDVWLSKGTCGETGEGLASEYDDGWNKYKTASELPTLAWDKLSAGPSALEKVNVDRNSHPPGMRPQSPPSISPRDSFHGEIRHRFACAESRQIMVFNLPNRFMSSELSQVFEAYGNVRFLHLNLAHRGVIFVGYFDVRNARDASARIAGGEIRSEFCIQIPVSKWTTGTRFVEGTLNVEVKGRVRDRNAMIQKFAHFGEIRSIRVVDDAPMRLVLLLEYYDIRAASEAMIHVRACADDGTPVMVTGLPMSTESLERSNAIHSFAFGTVPSYSGHGEPKRGAVNFKCGGDAIGSYANYIPMDVRHPGWHTSYDGGDAAQYGGYHSNEREIMGTIGRPIGRKEKNMRTYKKDNQRQQNFDISLHLIESGVDTRSTIMMRNIPQVHTKDAHRRIASILGIGATTFCR